MDESLKALLRITPEPCLYFDDAQVHHALTDDPKGYFRFVSEQLTQIAAGQSQLELPPKQVFEDPGSPSDFRVMPCVVRGASAARKTVKVVGTNIDQTIVPDQITVGKAFAIHPTENFVSHIFDACLLSSARTGLCANLAVSLLADTAESIGITGAGRVGYYAAFYAAALEQTRALYLTDLDLQRAQHTTGVLARQFPDIRFEAKAPQDMPKTEVLILATTSTQPICTPDCGASLVVSLGADTDSQHELDERWAGVADVFVDTEDSLRFGDLKAWMEKGLISAQQITSLLTLLRPGTCLEPVPHRIFVSTGSALFDNLTIGYLLEGRG